MIDAVRVNNTVPNLQVAGHPRAARCLSGYWRVRHSKQLFHDYGIIKRSRKEGSRRSEEPFATQGRGFFRASRGARCRKGSPCAEPLRGGLWGLMKRYGLRLWAEAGGSAAGRAIEAGKGSPGVARMSRVCALRQVDPRTRNEAGEEIRRRVAGGAGRHGHPPHMRARRRISTTTSRPRRH